MAALDRKEVEDMIARAITQAKKEADKALNVEVRKMSEKMKQMEDNIKGLTEEKDAWKKAFEELQEGINHLRISKEEGEISSFDDIEVEIKNKWKADIKEEIQTEMFWWSLVAEVDWWDAVGCTQSAVEEKLVAFHKVIAVLDTDFHSLPLLSHRQHYGPALDRIKCRMLEGVDGSDVRAVVLDMQARLLLEMLGKGIEAALVNPATSIAEPWMATSEALIGLVHDVMTVEPALVSYIQPYIDAVLDLASHFLTRLRRYATYCRTLATHAAGNQSLNASNSRLPNSAPNTAGSNPASSQGSQTSTTNSNGTSSVQAWVQGAIAKVNNSTEGSVSLTSTGATGTVPPLQLSVSQSAFPGMPAVRLVGDCNFLHRLCQLLLFCFIFRRRQQTRGVPTGPRSIDAMESSEEPGSGRSGRLGNGNAGQGYTSDEVKFLFLVSVTLCKKTSSLPHPMPKSQCGSASPLIRLHYPDGQYSVAPEVVEASLGQHIQLPRPRGVDSAGLLMRELELHPPAEDWSKRNLFGGPWAGALDLYLPLDEKEDLITTAEFQSPVASFLGEEATKFRELWPRKRRFSERDTAFGVSTAVSMGSFSGFMGSRRDTITAVWKNSPHGVWHKNSPSSGLRFFSRSNPLRSAFFTGNNRIKSPFFSQSSPFKSAFSAAEPLRAAFFSQSTPHQICVFHEFSAFVVDDRQVHWQNQTQVFLVILWMHGGQADTGLSTSKRKLTSMFSNYLLLEPATARDRGVKGKTNYNLSLDRCALLMDLGG
ncbi:hypothetical protein L7F22_062949 [Adiantum nelumboides]|nr:hypothetical protein [Adiantum nelumboides]